MPTRNLENLPYETLSITYEFLMEALQIISDESSCLPQYIFKISPLASQHKISILEILI